MHEQVTEAGFLHDVRNHQMEILKDEGLHRHIRFKQPGTSNMFFDIVTWPGCLCYTGDMGTYVFRRTEDMFQFFREKRHTPNQALFINPHYWAEKLEGIDRSDGVTEFSESKFRRLVKERFDQFVADEVLEDKEILESATEEDPLSESEKEVLEENQRKRDELWEAIENQVLSQLDDDRSGQLARFAAYHFDQPASYPNGAVFQDFWEEGPNEYTLRFIWCCYAIAWSIQEYEMAKDGGEGWFGLDHLHGEEARR